MVNGADQMSDCTADFGDFFFWQMMREEPFWVANEQYADFYMFWENYHNGSTTGGDDGWDDDWPEDDWNTECEEKTLDVTCDQFVMFEGEQCMINVAYNTCNDEEFYCMYNGFDEYRGQYSEDCTASFEDPMFWQMLSQEEFWFEDANQQYMDFYMFWNNYHIQEDPCGWKDINVMCSEFSFTEDDCIAYISYSPCVDDQFVCELSTLNEYNEYEIESCVEDFEDPEFWEVMRQEEWWMRPENEQYQDFYHFWNAFHYGGPTDTECEWKEVEAFCQDFAFLAEDECAIRASYSPCETGYFNCQVTTYGDYGEEVDDCAQDFEDIEFWQVMRMEAFWTLPENAEYFEFFEFWEDYHYGHGSDNCDDEWRWYDFECNEFTFTDPTDVCRIEVGFSSCGFECSVRREDDMGNAEDCARNFKDTEFWTVFSNEPRMQDPEFADFMAYWAEFHEGRSCTWDCDSMDCSAAFEMEMCEEVSCFNTCDQDYHCHVNYIWEDSMGTVSCEDFRNYTQGNAT